MIRITALERQLGVFGALIEAIVLRVFSKFFTLLETANLESLGCFQLFNLVACLTAYSWRMLLIGRSF